MSKKITNAILTMGLVTVVGLSAGLSACTIKTKHPRARITISFNEKTYEIDYTLYRNMYPQTVQHFIELSDAGFYNNMIIHDYSSSDWVTGGYSYDDSEETGYSASYASSLPAYYENHSKEKEYYDLFEAGKLSPSVYKKLDTFVNKKGELEFTVSKQDAWCTLIGEFVNNDHRVEKNALTAQYGVLKMVYYPKGDTNQQVAIRNSSGQVMEHDYKYNCATSLFAMQVGTGTSYPVASYCAFAQLKNDKSKDALQSLQNAIADYLEDLGSSSAFSKKIENVKVDNLDTLAVDGGKEISRSFVAVSKPIIIKSIKVTKY